MRSKSALIPSLAVLALVALSACSGPSQLGQRDRQWVAGRTFVVTGASSGLGRGTALKLASYGGNVVLAARRAEALEQLAQEARAVGGQALPVPTDVSDPAQVERLAAAALARFGSIDVWINDAAVAALGRFEEVPLSDHARVVDVNLKGYVFGSHAALRQFRRQGYGTLVNVASVEGRIPLPYHASYAATTAAVLALDTALAQELRLGGLDRTIRVASVLPWAVDTPFWDHTANYTGGTPRMYSMDQPGKVVDSIVWMAVRPQQEYAVGWKARGVLLGHQVWPGLTEHVAANITQRAQVSTAPPAPATAGSLYVSPPTGTTVAGNAEARMEREDKERAARATR